MLYELQVECRFNIPDFGQSYCYKIVHCSVCHHYDIILDVVATFIAFRSFAQKSAAIDLDFFMNRGSV